MTTSMKMPITARMTMGAHPGGVPPPVRAGWMVSRNSRAIVPRAAKAENRQVMRMRRRLKRLMNRMPSAPPMTPVTPTATCAVIAVEVPMPAYWSTLGA